MSLKIAEYFSNLDLIFVTLSFIITVIVPIIVLSEAYPFRTPGSERPQNEL